MATKKRKTAKKSTRTGRPTKLTPELHDKIVQWRIAQYSMIDIARLSGVCRENIRNWLQRGATDKGTEAEKRLVRAYETAAEQLAMDATETIGKAIKNGDVLASKFILERLRRGVFGVGVQKIAITDTEGKDVPLPGHLKNIHPAVFAWIAQNDAMPGEELAKQLIEDWEKDQAK